MAHLTQGAPDRLATHTQATHLKAHLSQGLTCTAQTTQMVQGTQISTSPPPNLPSRTRLVALPTHYATAMAHLTHTPKSAAMTPDMIALHFVLDTPISSAPEAETRRTTTAQKTTPMAHLTLEAQGTQSTHQMAHLSQGPIHHMAHLTQISREMSVSTASPLSVTLHTGQMAILTPLVIRMAHLTQMVPR